MQPLQSPLTILGPGQNRALLRATWPLAAFAAIGAVAAACTGAASPGMVSEGPPLATEARGIFHEVDGAASGTVALEREVDGSLAVAFEDLSTPSNAHIHVIVVPGSDVTRDQDVDPGTIIDLGPLKARTGMQDYWFPSSVAIKALTDRTVVVWDADSGRAVAAAPLGSSSSPSSDGGA
jgi:hypothetical protein